MADEKQTLIKVKLNRAHWIGEERIEPPTVISVTVDEALRLIESGVASRTDKLTAE